MLKNSLKKYIFQSACSILQVTSPTGHLPCSCWKLVCPCEPLPCASVFPITLECCQTIAFGASPRMPLTTLPLGKYRKIYFFLMSPLGFLVFFSFWFVTCIKNTGRSLSLQSWMTADRLDLSVWRKNRL